MPRKPVNPAESYWFILPDELDLPAAEQGRFKLAPIPMAEVHLVWDARERVTTAGGVLLTESRAFQQTRELVLDYLLATDNVPSDAPSPWPGQDAPRAERERWLAENLTPINVAVLGAEIRSRSMFGAAEGK